MYIYSCTRICLGRQKCPQKYNHVLLRVQPVFKDKKLRVTSVNILKDCTSTIAGALWIVLQKLTCHAAPFQLNATNIFDAVSIWNLNSTDTIWAGLSDQLCVCRSTYIQNNTW